jgi:hypothetical protein
MFRRARQAVTAVVLTMMLGVPAGAMAHLDYYSPSGNNVTWPVGPS